MVNACSTYRILKNPFVAAAVFCAVIIYSGLFSLPKLKCTQCVIQSKDIIAVRGVVSSSPVKTSGGYRCYLKAESAVSYNGITGSCRGLFPVAIDTALFESFFPGRLYTDAITGQKERLFSIDTGAHLEFSGNFRGDVFYSGKYKKIESGYQNTLARCRAICRLHFRRLMYSWGEAGGLLLALLMGSKEYMEASVSDAFRSAGLSHILALSGLHISMFAGAMLFLGHLTSHKTGEFLRLIATLVFVWFAGCSPSLLRALLCGLLAMGASAGGAKQMPSIILLSISFLLHAYIAPYHLTQLAFILSYAALAGMILTKDIFMTYIVRLIPPALSNALATSCAANAFTAPIVIHFFGSFAPIGIIAVLFVSPLVIMIMYTGLLCIVLSMIFPALSDILSTVVYVLYIAIKKVVLFFARWGTT